MPRSFKLLTNKYFVALLWFGLSLFAVLKQVIGRSYNNYLIYKYTFINLISRTNLYLPQPNHFVDVNHYGPIFALVIAPFTLFPDGLSVVLWTMANAGLLYYAIQQLPLTLQQRTLIILLCAHELMTSSFSVQFNPAMTALIILSFTLVKRKQDFWAAFMIVLGTYIKLYGIVGLAFSFFSEHKLKFIGSLIFWGIVLFVLPMLFSSPAFTIECYYDWYNNLKEKNIANAASIMQDISVMGMIRRVFRYKQLNDLIVLTPAAFVFLASYLRFREYSKLQYQLLILASTLIFTVVFSTGSESPTYIIAFAGVAIWYANLNRPVNNFEVALLVFAFIITSLSPSDLFPQIINRTYVKPYALKALPCFVIWIRIVSETLFRKFSAKTLNAVAV